MAVFYPTKRLYSVHNSNDDKDSNLHDADDPLRNLTANALSRANREELRIRRTEEQARQDGVTIFV